MSEMAGSARVMFHLSHKRRTTTAHVEFHGASRQGNLHVLARHLRTITVSSIRIRRMSGFETRQVQYNELRAPHSLLGQVQVRVEHDQFSQHSNELNASFPYVSSAIPGQ